MKRWLSEALFWAAIGFVGCSFLLGAIGVEISSGLQAEFDSSMAQGFWSFVAPCNSRGCNRFHL